jgi:hypothetical protein
MGAASSTDKTTGNVTKQLTLGVAIRSAVGSRKQRGMLRKFIDSSPKHGG